MSIQLQDMDSLLRVEKGWEKNHTGNEYVYDFHLNKFPVIIKVLSTIPVNEKEKRNEGSDNIRVFAVLKDETGRISKGLLKATKLNPNGNWKEALKTLVFKKIGQAKFVYKKLNQR